MKILVALSRFPYPVDKGDKLRAYYQIRELSRSNDIFLVCLSSEKPVQAGIDHLLKFCKSVEVIHIGFIQRCWNLFKGIFNGLPFQVNYFRSPEMKSRIADLLKKDHIDICYVQLIRLALNIPFSLHTKYYLDYMDSFSEGMKKRIKFSRWYEKPLVMLEAARLKNFEERVFYQFNGYSIISSSDAETFPLYIRRKMEVIPNGVDEKYFEYKPYPKDKEFDLIFTGNMGYHPNIQACKFLVNEIMPILKKKNIRVCLAGTNPSREVTNLKSANVIVTGYVEDIREYLAKSKIFVAPLFSGSGLQNKLLESMAMGLPAVTTPLANTALNAQPDKEIFVCPDKKSFAEKIDMLLLNPALAKQAGEAGKAFIKKNYNWTAYNSILEEAFRKVL